METRQCTKCKRILPMDINHFKKSKRNPQGFNPQCKECTGSSFIPYVKEGHKVCSKCKRELPLNEYHFMKQNDRGCGFRSQCKECLGYQFTKPKPVAREGYKICTKCGKELKATTDYFFKASDCQYGLMGYCKECGGYHFSKPKPKEGYKHCSKCGKELPATTQYFSGWVNNKLYPSCRECNGSEYLPDYGYKKCNKCGKVYPANKRYFPINKACKYGVSPTCKKCHKIYIDKYVEENKESIIIKRKIYYEKNKVEIQSYRKMFKKLNKEHVAQLNKKYKNTRRAKEKNAENDLTLNDWKECLKFFDYKDAYTGLPMKIISQDHVIPVNDNGGYTKSNIVPCEKDINASKNDHNMEEWYKRQSFYSEQRLNKIYEWINMNKKTKHS